MRRRALICLLGAVAAWPFSTHAETAMPTIGILVYGAPPRDSFDALVRALRDLGYVEGHSITIEARWSLDLAAETWMALTRDLVSRGVKLVVAGDTNNALAARSVTTTIPIIGTTLT